MFGHTRLHPLTLAHTLHTFRTSHVCGCAKFRTFALLHTFLKKIWKKPCSHICTHIAHILHVARVRMCEISHIRTFAHIFENKIWKKPCSHIAHISHVAPTRKLYTFGMCAVVRNFTHSRTFLQSFANKLNWPRLHTHRTHFARLQMCEFPTFALLNSACASKQDFIVL